MLRMNHSYSFKQFLNISLRCFSQACVLILGLVAFSQPSYSQQSRRNVNLEWEDVEYASKYQIRLVRKPRPDTSEPPRIFKTTEARWSGPLKPGQYTMELRSLDDRGVPGEWSDPIALTVKVPYPVPLKPVYGKKVLTQENQEYDTKFTWKKISGAQGYKLEVKSLDGSYTESKQLDEDESEVEISLKVAQIYQWRVYALMGNETPGEIPERWQKFALIGAQLKPPELKTPLSKYVQDLTWEPTEYAQSYDCIVQRKTKTGWKLMSKVRSHRQTTLPFDLGNPSGDYRLKVQATGKLREKSKISSMDFQVRGGIRSPAALENAQLRDSLERPSHLYYIASYLLTQINYQGVDHELNSGASFNAVGGTGRLGVGYQNANSLWGGFGIVDLSGFDLDGERYTFAAAEIHGTYKQYWGKNQILYGAGVFLKQLPDLRGSESAGFTGLGKIQNYGPHLGVQMWRPITSRLGFQVQARAYVSMFGSAPNGESVATAVSFQTGVLGTYRLNAQMMGYAGYVYRQDNSLYDASPYSAANPDSFADPGDLNSVKIVGHYLNLKLEYSY